MKLTITGYSTALFSTFYFIEELGVLLDAGEGITMTLLQKARKVEQVFISHADRDHLTGLLQFNQLNAREGFPKIYYPSDCGSFPALEIFTKKFDPHVSGTIWKGIEENEIIPIKDRYVVQSIRNEHVRAEKGVNKSLGYQIFEQKTKLKNEYLSLPKQELLTLMNQVGKENLTEEIRTNLLTYSGDTPIDKTYQKWNNTKILIHEATFLGREEHEKMNLKGNRHSNLEEVLEMVKHLNIETLILGHFSSRYTHEQIISAIQKQAKYLQLKLPIYAVLPSEVHRNILQQPRIWG